MGFYLGIDPGVQGAVCLLDTSLPVSKFHPMPGNKVRVKDVVDWIKVGDLPFKGIAIEDVHSLYGMSAKSNFQFGKNVGFAHAIADMIDIPVTLVQPKVWQKKVGVVFPKGTDPVIRKTITTRRALELYPTAQIYGKRGGLLDGRVDALMIAHYLSLQEES